MTERVIVYHDNCHDGITALWVALQRWPNAEPYPAKYDEPPDLDRLRDKDVVIVDFSWKRGPLSDVLDVCNTLYIIDHHKTAQEELSGFVGNIISKYRCVFDMERSGAGLAWDELIGGPRPRLVDHVEDRDLWRFKLQGTREIHAACNIHPLTLEARRDLMLRDVSELEREGRAVLAYHDKLVESAARYVTREVIAGYDVPSVACPIVEVISDLGHRLARGEPFAATYATKPDGSRVYSLRSSEGGIDVGAIAAQLGGGGHRNAAGFTRVCVERKGGESDG